MPIAPQVPTAAPSAPTAPVVQGATPVLVPAPSIADLQAQVQVLTGQLAGLAAQRNGLRSELRSQYVPAQAARIAELDGVNHQIAIVGGSLANARAQLDARQNFGQTAAPRVNFPVRRADPDLLVGLAFAFIFAVMMPIALAHARRIWRGKPQDAARRPDELSGARLERLEQAVDSIAIEIERVSEGQRFVTKVLAERMPVAAAKSPAPESAEPQLRALGAGPIEPIRVAERQAVRQSITPH